MATGRRLPRNTEPLDQPGETDSGLRAEARDLLRLSHVPAHPRQRVSLLSSGRIPTASTSRITAAKARV